MADSGIEWDGSTASSRTGRELAKYSGGIGLNNVVEIRLG
jgi:hypothetical protein